MNNVKGLIRTLRKIEIVFPLLECNSFKDGGINGNQIGKRDTNTEERL